MADALREKIAAGEIGPGDPLPSIVALAAEYGVTTNTTQKALRILKREGLVTSVPGYGVFVAEV
ncbi:MAG TPA: winged helix-turn-helix domain-containing protein [Streptosporangiaceae bacterium]|nr:winged helix-turn-helix domain-containing protein [Streptosporangiaceae bacterium]